MDATESRFAREEAAAEMVVASIDAKVADKLLKRARKHSISNEAATELANAWKRAATKTKHWQRPQRGG